jgi:putative spermidine/putrescine transport system substrate-binding protein
MVGVLCLASVAFGGLTAGAAVQRDPAIPKKIYVGLEDGTLIVYSTSGGKSLSTRETSIYRNFERASGVKVKSDFVASDTAKFFAAMKAGSAPWDVIQLATPADLQNAKKAGYLMKIDPKIVPYNLIPKGDRDPYGVYAARFGFPVVWNLKKWPLSGRHPTRVTDLFNTKAFPGKRCMFNYPQYGGTLEYALLADGVQRSKLYPLDVNRALRKLDTIKSDIVWWSNADQSRQLFASGECDIGVMWNGGAYEYARNGGPLGVVWKDALYATDVWGIPKNAPHPKAAMAFLAHWLYDWKGQRAYTSQSPYPTAINGLAYPAVVNKWGPIGRNAALAMPENWRYYSANIGDIYKTFSKWLVS